jgi:hypothetical protein
MTVTATQWLPNKNWLEYGNGSQLCPTAGFGISSMESDDICLVPDFCSGHRDTRHMSFLSPVSFWKASCHKFCHFLVEKMLDEILSTGSEEFLVHLQWPASCALLPKTCRQWHHSLQKHEQRNKDHTTLYSTHPSSVKWRMYGAKYPCPHTFSHGMVL